MDHIKFQLINHLEDGFVFVPNPGNAGDDLITYATIQIFNNLGYQFTMSEYTACHTDKVLVYGGGGNFNPIYTACREFLDKNLHVNKKIVLLPHTIVSCLHDLKKINDNVVIFCREKISYQYVQSTVLHPKNVHLSKDMALYICLDDLGIPYMKGEGHLNAFRTDGEKTKVDIPKNNVDVSLVYQYPGITIEAKKKSTQVFLNYINRFETVTTNRLHVAIGAAILGKRVTLLANAYYKNKAIYDFSIHELYPNVTFKTM